jgi:hypothetical protein
MVTAVVALALTVIASIVSIAFDIHRVDVMRELLSDASSGNVVRYLPDLSAANASDHQTAVIGIVEAVTLVISGVCFIAWFRLAYTNLLRLGATTMRYGHGWAIGAWFVPILNLWRPKQIANDIWRGSDPEHSGEQPTWSERVSPLLWWWWGAWLLTWLMSRASATAWTDAKSVHDVRSAAGLDIAAECVSIVAAGLAIAVVCTTTSRQRARSGKLEELPTQQSEPTPA